MADWAPSTATILFTDVVGSTELRGRLGEAAADRLFVEHQRRLGDGDRRHGGQRRQYRRRRGDGGVRRRLRRPCTRPIAMQRQVAGTAGARRPRRAWPPATSAGRATTASGCPSSPRPGSRRRPTAGRSSSADIVRLLAGDRAGDVTSRSARSSSRACPTRRGLRGRTGTAPGDGRRAAGAARPPCRSPSPVAAPPRLRRTGRGRRRPLGRRGTTPGRPGARSCSIGGEAGAGKTRLAVRVRPRGARRGGRGAVRRMRRRPRPAVPAVGAGRSTSCWPRCRGPVAGDAASRRAGAARPAPARARAARPPAAGRDRRPRGRALPHVRRVRRPARRGRRHAADGSWSSTTCTGPGRRRWRCCATSPARAAERAPRRRHVPRHGRRGHRAARGCLADLRRVDGVEPSAPRRSRRRAVERFVADAVGHDSTTASRRSPPSWPSAAAATPSTSASCGVTSSTASVGRDGGRGWCAGRPATRRPRQRPRRGRRPARRPVRSARRIIELAASAGQRSTCRCSSRPPASPPTSSTPRVDELVAAGLLAGIAGRPSSTGSSTPSCATPSRPAIAGRRRARSTSTSPRPSRAPTRRTAGRSGRAGPPLRRGRPLGRLDKAVYYGRRAAAQAMRAAAYDEALAHLVVVLGLGAAGGAGPPSGRPRHGRAARASYRRAATHARGVHDRPEFGAGDVAADAAVGFELAMHFPACPAARGGDAPPGPGMIGDDAPGSGPG